jgi:hypothetical protein
MAFSPGSKKTLPSSTTAGILKAGWLRKHRTSRPAVAALLVDREAGGWSCPRAGVAMHTHAAHFCRLDVRPDLHLTHFGVLSSCSGGGPHIMGLACVAAGCSEGGGQVSGREGPSSRALASSCPRHLPQ